MSNGYLVAASADISTAHEIAGGFGLDVVDGSGVGDREGAASALANAANVGILISAAAAADAAYVALLQVIAARVLRAQLIVAEPSAREAFAFLPTLWPVMSLDDARARAGALARQRDEQAAPPVSEPEPPPPTAEVEPEPPPVEPEPEAPADAGAEAPLEAHDEAPAESSDDAATGGEAHDEAASETQAADDGLLGGVDADTPAEESAPPTQEEHREEDRFGASEDAVAAEPPADVARKRAEPPEPEPEPPAPPASVAPPEPPSAPTPIPPPAKAEPPPAPQTRSRAGAGAASAPADATAFAPKKLRRGTPELVRIVVHQPRDLNEVIKAAKKIDPRTEPAPSGVSIGDVALGASVGVALEVRGATTDGAIQRRTWSGEPIDFSFAVEADAAVKQVVMLARVFVDDAQIGVLAFTRNVSGPAKKPHSAGDRVRLKRHKRVFLSYSSKDRETVSQIATAYQMAGVEHFWDRASLKSGEEWHPRLRREIDRADLFHLCWSKAASESEWVKKETEHALTRRKRNSGKPDITVQMLDGPPWAPHPPELDSINFDDFVRAAIVGYARGDGS